VASLNVKIRTCLPIEIAQFPASANGASDLDDESRRLVWSVVDGPYSHHNGSTQVFAEGDGRARFVWIADLLPDELAASTGEAMQRGVEVVKQTLEARAAHRAH
jgi:hypothetical protein